MKNFLVLLLLLAQAVTVPAQVPQLISYQGRVAVDGVNFDGPGQFKFAFVNAAGATTYWSNDGSSSAGSEPDAAITLPVSKGLYSVLLGDATLDHMSIVPATVFIHGDVHLRVWFSDGVNGFQQLTPDRRIAAVGYAMMADRVSDGAITTAKIADGAVTSEKLAPGALGIVQGTLPWVVVSGTFQQAEANKGYVAANAAEVTITLPATPAVGDIVRVSGAGAGGWKIAQNSGQMIAGSLLVQPGTSWVARENSRNWTSIASSSDGSKLLASAYDDRLYTSTDSGFTWTPRVTNQAWKAVASSADGTKLVAVVVNGQIHTSTDSGVTWVPRDSARNWSCVASSADGTKLVAAVQGGKIYKSIDSGVTWATAIFIDAQWNSIASSADGVRLLASSGSSGNLYRSNDSGGSWLILSGGDLGNNSRNWTCVNMSSNGEIMIASTELGSGGSIWVSNNAGSYWTERYRPINAYSVVCSASGRTIIIPGFISLDFGQSWTPRDMPGTHFTVSADGSKIASVGSQVYISSTDTTLGVNGRLRGQSSSSVELQYIGNGRFLPLSSLGTFYPY